MNKDNSCEQCVCIYMYIHGGFPNLGYHFGGPYNEAYSIMGSILGSPYFEKLPYIYIQAYIVMIALHPCTRETSSVDVYM